MSAFASRVRWFAPLIALVAGCSTNVKTTHYLGVFDPQEQVPAELYRITIEGNAGVFSKVNYATGWVPANAADLLSVDVRPSQDGKIEITGDQSKTVTVGARRQFFEIGPTGVATQPEDGRFVVVMSSNPDYFFKKVGMLSRFGTDDSANEASRRALMSTIQAKRAQVASDAVATQDQRASAAAGSQ